MNTKSKENVQTILRVPLRDASLKNQRAVIGLSMLAVMLIFQMFPTTVSASDIFSLGNGVMFFSADTSSTVSTSVENQMPIADQYYSVGVGNTIDFYWTRVFPLPASETCIANTNSNFVQLSLSPNGVFSWSVQFQWSGNALAQTPRIYARGIAPANNVPVTLTCQASINNDVAYVTVTPPPPPPTPTPTPTPNPVPATITVAWPGGAEGSLAVNARRTVNILIANLSVSGSLIIRDQSSDFAFTPIPSEGSAPPFTSSISIPITVNGTSNLTIPIFIKAIKASGYNRNIEVIFVNQSNQTILSTTATLLPMNAQSIWFERDAGQVAIDNNPMYGGGLRVFPEKKSPTDTSSGRDRVTVKAKVFPAVPGKKVEFTISDVDDPEFVLLTDHNGDPADTHGATDVDSNGVLGGDNRDVSYFISSHASGTTSYTDVNGVASAVFRMSPQPGDNIRVRAVVQGETYLNYTAIASVGGVSIRNHPVDIAMPDGRVTPANIAFKDANGNLIKETGGNTAVAVATKMLTTWRRLHLEVDSMGTVTNNFLTGSIVNTAPVTAFSTKLTTNLSMERGRFVGGRIEITTNGIKKPYKILDSHVNTVTVQAVLTDTLIGSSFKMFDDDDMNADDAGIADGDNGEDVPSPSLGWLQDTDSPVTNRLYPVYIRPTYDLAGNQDNLPFYLNAPKADLSADDSTVAEKEILTDFNNETTRKDKEFWTGYILGAYQTFSQKDLDPNDAGFLGESHPNFGSISYLELVSESDNHQNIQPGELGFDLYYNWNSIALHEIAHLLRADHDGGYMSAQYFWFSGISQHKIRSSEVPWMADVP